tara:strand:- start:355 stop:636 length:282 start_codon:yes stop_codon:yes gene_type:complete
MSADKNNSIFIKCACEGEGMGIDYDSSDGYYYFSYWSYGLSNRKMSWRDKIRYCWQVWKGKPFNDELMLTKDQASKLENFLLLCRNKEAQEDG